jgi:hypothetical protein
MPHPTAAFDGQSSSETTIDLRDALLRIAALEWSYDEAALETVRDGSAPPGGRFEGLPPHVALLEDGRKARLLKPLTFIHPAWDPWPVPAEIEVDGASIPRPFWTLIGGPFEGRYRDASIVHDHYCVTKERAWHDVHRMFYEAMLTSGVGKAKAKVMYYAVYRFGPRWALDDLTESALVGDVLPEALGDAQAESLARDAQAIYVHDLNLDEIEMLAEARSGASAHESATESLESARSPDAATRQRARSLVIVGGSGTADDHEAVATQAAFLPDYLITRLLSKGVRIVACRNSITDFETDLRGVVPRGWEKTSKTWDHVPGAYFPDRKRVVIATWGVKGVRAVPQKTSLLHGSADLVVHESLHGYDYIGGHAALHDPRFIVARQADLNKLGAYERQAGQAGLEETFAESGARFAVDPDAMRRDWPGLFSFWSLGPLGAVEIPPEPLESTGLDDAPIGTAEMLESGEIAIDLRAEGPGGAIGHAWLTISPDDPSYHAILSNFSGEEGLESAPSPGQQVLIQP